MLVPVIYSEITPVWCFDRSKSVWTEEQAILSQSDDIAYMLTSVTVKQTICGEIIKGVILRRADSNVVATTTSNIDDNVQSKILAHQDNLWEVTNDYVVIKVDRRKTMEQIHKSNPENPWKEVAALQLLGNNHPNIISLMDAFMDKQCLYEVMPFCPKGNLKSSISNHPAGLTEKRAREIFSQILRGVYYIHSRGVAHHDISTDNVMLDEDGRCVIIDFGMCLRIPYSYPDDPNCILEDVTDITVGTKRRLIHSQNHCGKLRFMAPEIYQKEVAGFDGYASDLWSLGVVLFVLLTGRQPYERPDEKDPGYHDLVDPHFYWDMKEINPVLSWGHDMSPTAVHLLRKMLCPDPRDRATLGWILNHEWLKSPSVESQ